MQTRQLFLQQLKSLNKLFHMLRQLYMYTEEENDLTPYSINQNLKLQNTKNTIQQ